MAEPESTDTLPSGQRRTLDLLDAYVDHIRDTVKLARPMKIAIDCGNGVGGAVAARLFRALGCAVDELYCQVDASFPNHHPDPPAPRHFHAQPNTAKANHRKPGHTSHA